MTLFDNGHKCPGCNIHCERVKSQEWQHCPECTICYAGKFTDVWDKYHNENRLKKKLHKLRKEQQQQTA